MGGVSGVKKETLWSQFFGSTVQKIWFALGAIGLWFGIYGPMHPYAGQIAQQYGIDFVKMGGFLFFGLGVFLWGMEIMADALRRIAGERMKSILAKMTSSEGTSTLSHWWGRLKGVITGAGVTAVVQSSSVTTVILVGFVTAGLMSLAQTVGVIFGANIGTTITAQIVAFKVTKYATWLMIGGGAMFVLGTLFRGIASKFAQTGLIFLGLGMIFWGMNQMGGAMKPLREYEPFLDLMRSADSPMTGILIAAGFTALIQSSSATTGIVVAMAMEGLVSLPMGIALAFGANIGTCATAILASLGKNREAVQVAIVHVLFNVLGVVVWFYFIDDLASWVVAISPQADVGVVGAAKLAFETPRQIANAHTIFNVANTVIFFFSASIFAVIAEFLTGGKVGGSEENASVDNVAAAPATSAEPKLS